MAHRFSPETYGKRYLERATAIQAERQGLTERLDEHEEREDEVDSKWKEPWRVQFRLTVNHAIRRAPEGSSFHLDRPSFPGVLPCSKRCQAHENLIGAAAVDAKPPINTVGRTALPGRSRRAPGGAPQFAGEGVW